MDIQLGAVMAGLTRWPLLERDTGMAVSLALDRARLDRLAPALGDSVARLVPLPEGSRVEIGEAFEVWALGIVPPGTQRTLDDLAATTRRCHVQVYAGGDRTAARPAAVVTLADIDQAEWRIGGVSGASLADAVDRAIDRVDASQRVEGQAAPRLLVALPYRVHAFWFPQPGNAWVYIISALDDLAWIRPGEWMSPAEFIAGLAREHYVRGVADD